MAIIVESQRNSLSIDSIIGINQNTGNVLQGEKDMYERIIHDCDKSPFTWYMWYDKSFNISYAGQNEIQIDFLLICKEGAIVVEVKGGSVEIMRGCYYYSYKGVLTEMKRSPFEQANHYKWALLILLFTNNKWNYLSSFCQYHKWSSISIIITILNFYSSHILINIV